MVQIMTMYIRRYHFHYWHYLSITPLITIPQYKDGNYQKIITIPLNFTLQYKEWKYQKIIYSIIPQHKDGKHQNKNTYVSKIFFLFSGIWKQAVISPHRAEEHNIRTIPPQESSYSLRQTLSARGQQTARNGSLPDIGCDSVRFRGFQKPSELWDLRADEASGQGVC